MIHPPFFYCFSCILLCILWDCFVGLIIHQVDKRVWESNFVFIEFIISFFTQDAFSVFCPFQNTFAALSKVYSAVWKEYNSKSNEYLLIIPSPSELDDNYQLLAYSYQSNTNYHNNGPIRRIQGIHFCHCL